MTIETKGRKHKKEIFYQYIKLKILKVNENEAPYTWISFNI